MKLHNILFLLLLCVSCLYKNTQRKVVSLPTPYYEIGLTNAPKTARIKNVIFSTQGAYFGESLSESSYLALDSVPEIRNNFNISFWFKTEGRNGEISQTLVKALNTINPKEELRIWVAGQRVTGSLNSNRLSSKDFSKESPSSRTYYDLPRLEVGKFYFLSINKIENHFEIYINAELYEEYTIEKDTQILINSITFGVLNIEGPYINQLCGNLIHFEVYEQPLSKDEIYSVSVKHFNEIEPFNDAFELSKFNLKD